MVSSLNIVNQFSLLGFVKDCLLYTSKLGVPLVLHGFYGVPEVLPVCKSGRRMGRQHDLGVDKLFLLVVEFRFLVVLAEQPFAALISGPGNSGLPLAALDDGDFEMRTRNRHCLLYTSFPNSIIGIDDKVIPIIGFITIG